MRSQHDKVLCRFTKACKKSIQKWEKGNVATDRWGDRIRQWYDSNDNEELDVKEFHGDAAGLDYVDNCYDHDDNSSDKEFQARRFYGDVLESDVDDDDFYDHDDINDEELMLKGFMIILKSMILVMMIAMNMLMIAIMQNLMPDSFMVVS